MTWPEPAYAWRIVDGLWKLFPMAEVPPISSTPPTLPATIPSPPSLPLALPFPAPAPAPVQMPAALPELLPLPPEPTLLRSPSHVRTPKPIHRQTHIEFGAETPKPESPPVVANNGKSLWEHPFIGGKFTICVLCYGKHEDLARRCLDSIIRSVPVDRRDLRVATNEACQGTIDYLKQLPLTKLYINPANRFKYPVQREMFHDPACPIESPYLVWFDDDSYVVDNNWAEHLMHAIIDNHRQGYRLYGIKFVHDLASYATPGHRPLRWFAEADWYRGKPLQDRRGKEIPNGTNIHFVAGGFFALGTDALKAGNIPCPRLRHNGGDITIGEQVHQAGFRICSFNKGKKFIHSSGADRRGYSEAFQWAKSQAKQVKRG